MDPRLSYGIDGTDVLTLNIADTCQAKSQSSHFNHFLGALGKQAETFHYARVSGF